MKNITIVISKRNFIKLKDKKILLEFFDSIFSEYDFKLVYGETIYSNKIQNIILKVSSKLYKENHLKQLIKFLKEYTDDFKKRKGDWYSLNVGYFRINIYSDYPGGAILIKC